MGEHSCKNQKTIRWLSVWRSNVSSNEKENEEKMTINESSLSQLYDATVEAFPKTGKRQYATHLVKITKLESIPYQGMHTLYFKGLAQSEGKEYNPIILFKKVLYSENGISFIASDYKTYHVNPLSVEQNDVLVRCDCKDFKFRFSYYNHVDESLYGVKPKKYEGTGNGPPANPLELPGLCKHLIKLMSVIKQSKILI